MNRWIPWAMVGAAVLHVAEESASGWTDWVQAYAPGVTLAQFALVNAGFLLLCMTAAVLPSILFQLSIASLIVINAVIHIVPTVFLADTSPGIWSALILYLPLGFAAFRSAARMGELTLPRALLSVAIGLTLMAIPAAGQLIRIHLLQP